MKHTAAPLTRGRRLAIRVVGAIGVLLLAFFSIVALNVLGVVASGTEGAPDDPAPSVEARYGAAHPGEAVHAVGAVALVAIEPPRSLRCSFGRNVPATRIRCSLS